MRDVNAKLTFEQNANNRIFIQSLRIFDRFVFAYGKIRISRSTASYQSYVKISPQVV